LNCNVLSWIVELSLSSNTKKISKYQTIINNLKISKVYDSFRSEWNAYPMSHSTSICSSRKKENRREKQIKMRDEKKNI